MFKKIIKYLINILFNFFDLEVFIKRKRKNKYEIINKNDWIPLLKDEEYFYLYNLGLKKTGQEKTDNFSKRLRFFSLLQLVEHVLKNSELKKYNFAECGCWKGHSSFMISSILKKNDFKNKFFIFDSFEGGLSDLKEQDRSLIGDLKKKQIKDQKNFFKSNEEDVKKILNNFEFVEIFKGWIPEKFDDVVNKKFTFIHLDVDLYEPTLESLKFFYPKLEKGGVIVCDDYNLSAFPGAKIAWDEFFKDKKKEYQFFYESPFGGCYLIK